MLPLFMTALAPILWSTGALGVRLVESGPWAMVFWRSLFMALFLIVANRVTLGREFLPRFRETAIQGIWVAVFIACSLIFYVFSVTNTTVADSLLVQATGPMFIIILGWILLGEPVRRVTIAALLAVVAGIALIMVPSLSRGGFSGNVLGMLKALSFAAATLVIRKKRSVALLPAVAVAAVLSAAVSAVFAESLRVPPRELLVFAYLGLFQTGLAFTLHASFSGKLPASQTGILVLLESILGPIWVWIFLGEKPPLLTLLGGFIIIAALVAHTLIYYGDGRSLSRRNVAVQ